MKKKLESELISIAHRILKLKGKEDVITMHNEVSALYEKLSVLKFAHENFEDAQPTINNNSSFFETLNRTFNNTISDNIESEGKIYTNLDTTKAPDIIEPVMSKIKDMVAHMPEETKKTNTVFETSIPEKPTKTYNIEDITAGFEDIPVFEPISAPENKTVKKEKPLAQVKPGGLNIGLNDKIAFIKHLFDGKSEEYDRVLSQLNTSASLTETKHLIHNLVKPDYNNWEGKKEFEERFIKIIEGKFN